MNRVAAIVLVVTGVVVGLALSVVFEGEIVESVQQDRIEQKVDDLTEDQDQQSYAAFLIGYCEDRDRGFRSLACVRWTEEFLREIAAGPTVRRQRLKIPSIAGGCDIPGCLPRPSS
jgi:hypothetical protein